MATYFKLIITCQLPSGDDLYDEYKELFRNIDDVKATVNTEKQRLLDMGCSNINFDIKEFSK